MLCLEERGDSIGRRYFPYLGKYSAISVKEPNKEKRPYVLLKKERKGIEYG